MTRIKQTILLGITATAAIAAVAFAQAKEKIEAAAPAISASAPAYSLPDQNGIIRTSAENKGKVTLLAFYPADFTGGCTLEAHSLSASYKDLKALGVNVYGVSVQDSKSHQAFCTKEGIPYTLLADTDKKMAANYGVLIPGAGVADRVTYILGADGKVAYVDKNVNSHLTTCGDDWGDWIKAHPAIRTVASMPRDEGQLGGVVREASSMRTGLGMNKAMALHSATLGQTAPTFLLPEADTSKVYSLTNLSAGKKATVVMFISTRCPYSNAYNDRMTALAQKYGAKGVSFVGIDADQNELTPEVAAYAKAKAFPFPVLKATGDKVADAYNAHVTPETYVINSSGVLVYHGRIDNDMDPANVHVHDLANALDETLAGKPVAKPQTKAFGCSIKR
ncbi:MAG: redoxin domain-containing protein [Janthinobacterium lividum]